MSFPEVPALEKNWSELVVNFPDGASAVTVSEENPSDAAFEAGYQKGRAEAEAQLQAEITELKTQKEALSCFQDNFSQEKIKFLAAYAEEMQQLAFVIAKTIVQTELTASPEKIQHAIRDALQELTADKPATLFVHPTQQSALTTVFNAEQLTVSADAQLTEQDFYIVQGYSRLSGELETRLKQSITAAYST